MNNQSFVLSPSIKIPTICVQFRRYADNKSEPNKELQEELPKFLAELWSVFNSYELTGYVSTLKPKDRAKLRRLLFVK